MKNKLSILWALLGAAVLYYLYKRSQLPSNWSSLTPAQQQQYQAALNRAATIDGSAYQ